MDGFPLGVPALACPPLHFHVSNSCANWIILIQSQTRHDKHTDISNTIWAILPCLVKRSTETTNKRISQIAREIEEAGKKLRAPSVLQNGHRPNIRIMKR